MTGSKMTHFGFIKLKNHLSLMKVKEKVKQKTILLGKKLGKMNKPEIPEVDRIAAMLLVQEGYTYAQIAEKLKISKGAISKIKNV